MSRPNLDLAPIGNCSVSALIDRAGRFVWACAPRVEERLNYLLNIANTGGKPGRFAELLQHASGLAQAYLTGGLQAADRFAGLTTIQQVQVTGRAYSWMTDMDCYHPGGNFVKIPDTLGGAPGGNRYFTLRKEPL